MLPPDYMKYVFYSSLTLALLVLVVTVAPDIASAATTADPQDVFGPVMGTLMSMIAYLTGIAGSLLNKVISATVIGMGDYVRSLDAIVIAWRLLRDIGNLILIFGFLAIGITTILNVQWYGGGTKMLPTLLIAAVLLNFSLFIAEAIVDVGNLFATQVYVQINGGQLAPTTLAGTTQVVGISDIIMQRVGLQTLMNVNGNTAVALGDWNTANILAGLLGIILFLVAAFVLFALAFMLIARFVILLILIIISPIGFAGLAVPKLEGVAKKWWETLIAQTLTAPVLLLTLYIALKVITDNRYIAGFIGTGGTNELSLVYGSLAHGASNPDIVKFAGVFLSFLVAMGLLLACVFVAKQMSAFGASYATKLAGWASFGIGALGASAAVGGVSRLGRYGLQRLPENKYTATAKRVGSTILRAGERARMDVRSIPGVGAGLAAAGAGAAATPTERSAMGRIDQGRESFRHMVEESNKQYDKETTIPRLRQFISANDAVRAGRILTRMSDAQLESHEVTELLAHSGLAAALLSQARFDKLQQSDHVSDAMKDTLRTSRRGGIRARFSTNAYPNPQGQARFQGRTTADVTLNGAPDSAPGAGDGFAGLSSQSRAELDGDILTLEDPPNSGNFYVLDQLMGGDFNAIMRRGQVDPSSLQKISTYLRQELQRINARQAAGNPLSRRDATIIAARANPDFRGYYGLP